MSCARQDALPSSWETTQHWHPCFDCGWLCPDILLFNLFSPEHRAQREIRGYPVSHALCCFALKLLCVLTYTNGDLKGMEFMAWQGKSDQATIRECGGDCDSNNLLTLRLIHGVVGSQFIWWEVRCPLNLFYFIFRKTKERGRDGREGK